MRAQDKNRPPFCMGLHSLFMMMFSVVDSNTDSFWLKRSLQQQRRSFVIWQFRCARDYVHWFVSSMPNSYNVLFQQIKWPTSDILFDGAFQIDYYILIILPLLLISSWVPAACNANQGQEHLHRKIHGNRDPQLAHWPQATAKCGHITKALGNVVQSTHFGSVNASRRT